MSGIYIPGMEMPKEDRAFCIIIHHDGKVCHFFDLQGERIATAVPVPPHGRLIDAGAVINAIANRYLDDDFSRGWNAAMKQILEAMEDAPTIIPAEEGEG